MRYLLVWTPNYLGVPFKAEKHGSHDRLRDRLIEIQQGDDAEDLDYCVYIDMLLGKNGFSDEVIQRTLDHHNSMVEIYFENPISNRIRRHGHDPV